MAITANWYTNAMIGQFGATAARRVDWVTDTINVALCTVAYVPDQDANVFFSDVTNELPTAGGYTAGGLALAGKSVVVDNPTNETRLKGGSSIWGPPATFTCRIAVIYKSTGAAGTSPLLGWVNFGGDETVSSGTFTIAWDATNGLLKVAAA